MAVTANHRSQQIGENDQLDRMGRIVDTNLTRLLIGLTPTIISVGNQGGAGRDRGGDTFYVTYHIDARGAAVSIQNEIIRAVATLDRQLESRAVRAVASTRARNPGYLR